MAGSNNDLGDRNVAATARLARRLTTTDAVVIGLGSMIGAGVFAAFGPAADRVVRVYNGLDLAAFPYQPPGSDRPSSWRWAVSSKRRASST